MTNLASFGLISLHLLQPHMRQIPFKLFSIMFRIHQVHTNDVTSSWSVYTMNSAKEYIDGQYSGLVASPDLIGKISIIQGAEIESNTVAENTYI